ncbi:MAG: DUF937 domain-containing protein [Erythrobacter sp.]
MSLAQMLQQSGVIDSMAGELGVDPATAKTAAGALLPAIVAGMGRSATGGSGGDPLGGLGSLAGAVLGGGGGGLLESVLAPKPTPMNQGNDILGNIFGSKDVSRGVAGEVAAITGIDEGILKKMLPILAMAVAGHMAKKAGGGNGAGGGALGGILGSIVTGMMK